jgi:uncharacterized membrane protein
MSDLKTSSLKPAKPPFRWGRVVLFVSLAINLAVAGVVGGAVLGRIGDEKRDFAARDVGFGLFTEALTEADRKALRSAYVQAKPNIRAERQQMRDDLQTILTALRADPFEVETLRIALDTGAARIAQRQAVGQGVVLDYLEKMPTAERAALADRLEASLKRHPRGKKPPRGDDGGPRPD